METELVRMGQIQGKFCVEFIKDEFNLTGYTCEDTCSVKTQIWLEQRTDYKYPAQVRQRELLLSLEEAVSHKLKA
jgi:hypothetical protein